MGAILVFYAASHRTWGISDLGERALRSILDRVLAVGDEAETNYLEVKSALDPTSTAGAAKVAKFLLGAANRRPEEAVRYFHGYAVLVIGAQKSRAGGVARGVEAHELEDRIRPYLGPQFPAFEFGRIGVDADREVLFIIAQPPKDGQSIFPCHKSFHGNKGQECLDDGAIYVRGSSNTRPARAGEVLALVERARSASKSPISLDVKVLGSISRVERVDEVIERLYKFKEKKFIKPQKTAEFSPPAAFLARSFLGVSQPASPEDRVKRLESWKREKPAHIERGRAHFLGVALPGVGTQVISRDRFVAKPYLIVTFHDCEAFDYQKPDDANLDKVIEPVVRPHDPYGGFDPSDLRFTPRGYPVEWSNRGNDVEVVLTPESFRPNVPRSSDQDDYVLLARNPQAQTVAVTWVLTEDGNDAATTGKLDIALGGLAEAVDLLQTSFLNKA